MKALFARQLLIASRTPGLAAACCLQAGVLGAFALIWRQGVPALPGDNLYEQQRLLQWSLLSVLLPWAASRCLPARAARDLAFTAAVAATSPARAAACGTLAIFGVLLVIVLTGLGPVVLTQQISGIPVGRVLAGLLPLAVAAAVAATSSYVVAARGGGPLFTWIAASLLTASISWMIVRLPGAGLAAGVAAILVAFVAMRRFDGSLSYPHEVRS